MYRIQAWPVDGLHRVFPNDPPPKEAPRRCAAGWDLAGARGEFITFQVGLWGCLNFLREVDVVASALQCPGHKLPASLVRVRYAGLIPLSVDSWADQYAERPELVPGWYPDPLPDQPAYKDPLGKTYAVIGTSAHLTLAIPRGAAPGTYRGQVTVLEAGKPLYRLPVRLTVWPFALPKRPTFHVTNWFHLDCLSTWHRCEPWSERHWGIIERYAKEMAAHRQDTISTPTLTGNFHNFDRMTLVDTTRGRDGAYRFDFGRLERWVKLFDRLGFRLFEMWHLASQGHGKFLPRMRYFDERRREWREHVELPVESAEYRRLVQAFLRDLCVWTDSRRLTDRFLLHNYDEPQPDTWDVRYARLGRQFKEWAPRLKQIDAINKSAIITRHGATVDIPVPCTPHLEDEDGYYRQRARAGREPVWWYTCCGPNGPHANRFVHMPLLNTRMIHWQSFAFNVGGYLHWGYNFWHRVHQERSGWPGISSYADRTLVNPYREHPFVWATGDAAIVYPHPRWWEDHGPVTSLRYEAMREGLQDYELLRMLAAHADGTQPRGQPPKRRAAIRKARALLKAVRGPIAGTLTKFCRDPGTLLRCRREVGKTLATLADEG